MYVQNIGLARVISKSLRHAGLHVERSLNESLMRVSSDDGGEVVLECKFDDVSERTSTVDMWTSPDAADLQASKSLLRPLATMLRKSGLRVKVAEWAAMR